MARVTREVLKNHFVTGAKPSQDNFEDLIDSLLHVEDNLQNALSNYATHTEAILGSSTTTLMTPARTKEAIFALVRLRNIQGLQDEIDAIIQSVVGAAPESLNTLQEIATALSNDANLYATLTDQINRRALAQHTHDGRYYTEQEMDAFFEGTMNGKKRISWGNITERPSMLTGSSIPGEDVSGFSLWKPPVRSITSPILSYSASSLEVGGVGVSGHVRVLTGRGSSEQGGLKTKNIEATAYLKSASGLYVGTRQVVNEDGHFVTEGGVGSAAIANDAITADKVADNSITAAKLESTYRLNNRFSSYSVGSGSGVRLGFNDNVAYSTSNTTTHRWDVISFQGVKQGRLYSMSGLFYRSTAFVQGSEPFVRDDTPVPNDGYSFTLEGSGSGESSFLSGVRRVFSDNNGGSTSFANARAYFDGRYQLQNNIIWEIGASGPRIAGVVAFVRYIYQRGMVFYCLPPRTYGENDNQSPVVSEDIPYGKVISGRLLRLDVALYLTE